MFHQLRHAMRLFGYSWRTLDGRALVRGALHWSTDREARSVDSGFDARYGTDTNTGLTPVEAGIPAERRDHATMYLPTMDRDLDAMLAALAWAPARLREATFVDLGSGKARVVLLAAMRRFREVVGVELSPVLHEVAIRNVARVGAAGALCSPVRLMLDDATRWAVPGGPLVVFLYHPFRDPVAAEVMARLNAALIAAPRPAAILYGHPTLQVPIDPAVFAVDGVFQRQAEGGRQTRRFRIGWSVWTNAAWLEHATLARTAG